jgi:hypothetical protein
MAYVQSGAGQWPEWVNRSGPSDCILLIIKRLSANFPANMAQIAQKELQKREAGDRLLNE